MAKMLALQQELVQDGKSKQWRDHISCCTPLPTSSDDFIYLGGPAEEEICGEACPQVLPD